ncbi:hypothetical protein ACFE04_014505 [Oxalis oulophora]
MYSTTNSTQSISPFVIGNGAVTVGEDDYYYYTSSASSSVGVDGSHILLPSLVMTTDPKPRLRWTTDLHDCFIDAVTQLGGPDKATPKTLMRTMGVKGLTLYHIKSHLQKYRMGKLSRKESADNSKDGESQDTTSSSTTSSSRMGAQDLNDSSYQFDEALRVQMEVHRRLHEQLEFGAKQVQRHVELRIEAQDKYLQTILEKACKVLNDQNIGLEAASENFSELTIKVSNHCQETVSAHVTDCAVDSCLP